MAAYADASASLLGYQFQLRMALLTAIRAYKNSPSREISIEKFDDIAVHQGSNVTDSIQTKHHIVPGNLADTSPDFWRTLGVWAHRTSTYHVLAHLAIHWWFRQRQRPVPAVLVFDQPSQAHYPPELDDEGRLDPLKDADRLAVHKLFSLISDAASGAGSGMQIIVLDHAHINEQWFESRIIEEWRRGVALVPLNWYAD
jgi:hypothetical protein